MWTVPKIRMCSPGHYPGEKSNSNREWKENCSHCSGRAAGLAPDPRFCFVSLHPILFYHGVMRGVYSSWDYSHSGIWMSAAKTEDFLCVQDISVFLITLQGFYCKLLLRFPAAVQAHRFGACFLQELWNNRMENPVKAHCSGERLFTNLTAFWQHLWRLCCQYFNIL